MVGHGLVVRGWINQRRFEPFANSEFQHFLQPWWINQRRFEPFENTEFQNFLQPWWMNQKRFEPFGNTKFQKFLAGVVTYTAAAT